MAVKRFFCSPISGERITLDPREAHYLREVLRLRTGDRVELLDGEGKLAHGVIESVSAKQVQIAVEKLEATPPRKTGRIVIAASMAKGDRFEWLIEKCTELDADRICPILFERTVKRPTGENLLKRYQNLAMEASKQCRRIHLPAIDSPVSLPESVERLQKEYPRGQVLYGSVGGESIWTARLDFEQSDFIVYIGPEGDFTEEELSLLQEVKAWPIQIGTTVLRVETAGVAFASCLTAMRMGTSLHKHV